MVDRRYELAGACRTKVINGMCRVVEWNGTKVYSEYERVDLVRQRFPWYFDKTISMADDSYLYR